MPEPVTPRLSVLNTLFSDRNTKAKINTAFNHNKGNWKDVLKELREANVPDTTIKKIDFVHSLAVITDDNEKLVQSFSSVTGIEDLRSFAYKNDKDSIEALISVDDIPDTISAEDPLDRKKMYAEKIANKLFAAETSAVIHRMADMGKLPVNTTVRSGISSFLANQPDFNIRTTSVYNAIRNIEAFKGIPEDQHESIIKELKAIQRVQAISPNVEALSHLVEKNISSAYQLTEMPEKDFLSTVSEKLGEETAKEIYTNATNIKIRNEQALMAMHEYLNEPQIAAINRSPVKEVKKKELQKKTDDLQIPVNWENLFGSIDYCECGECNSVYSPASYFVELLQYLRNNNLKAGNINTNVKGIAGTPLEKLFRRRPDLGCLELTCKNTNTVLPYIDLVNEVMESFVVHLDEYHADPLNPKQAKIEHWNIQDETTGELLAQPQHINYEAYCILKKAVYPFTLPYHQPVDAIRIFLKFLETSRYELMKIFRSSGMEISSNDELPDEGNMPVAAPDPNKEELLKLNNEALDRAIGAEYLGLTQEEYIILTKQAFWDKKYFEIKCNKNFTVDEYREKIGVKKIHQYYGYSTEAEMLNTDSSKKTGLKFVKKQFLPRTGISYIELVEILKTKFINPLYPQGQSLKLLESIHFSYRYLQMFIDNSSSDPKVRYAKLIAFLKKANPFMPLLDAYLNPDPCSVKAIDHCVETKHLETWVNCHFEKLGKLIVLENEITCTCNKGQLLWTQDGKVRETQHFLLDDGNMIDDGTYFLNEDCTVTAEGHHTGSGEEVHITVGKVDNFSGQLKLTGGHFHSNADNEFIVLKLDTGHMYRLHEDIFISMQDRKPLTCTSLANPDNCNIEKVRLMHLDGTEIEPLEYDKFQRFIRLWRKLGWTIDETDKAIIGLGAYKIQGSVELPVEDDCIDCFSEFAADCACEDGEDPCPCPPEKNKDIHYDITPHFLTQLVSVKKLLESTGLELTKLQTFWTSISTRGEKSLYSRLFLKHNLTAIDPVFKPDNNGNYLTKKEKIKDHIPVLMAAFNLKAEDMTAIMEFRQIPDELTLENLSIFYRHSLLMKLLGIKSYDLKNVIGLLPHNPFSNAKNTWKFIRFWEKMEDAGFDFKQLNYVIKNIDDEKKPLSPKKNFLLQLSKTLYEGLNQIDKDHPDLDKIDTETIKNLSELSSAEDKDNLLRSKATEDLVRAKTSLVFDQSTVASILSLLQGSTQYNTNAPKNLVTTTDDFVKLFPAATDQQKSESERLQKKIKYDFTNGAILVTGILTEKEKTTLKSFFNPPDWAKAIDRVSKQALYFFNDVLSGIFGNDLVKAKEFLLQGDISITDEQQDPINPLINTAPVKRKYFLEIFIPFLREKLTHRFLVDQLSSAAGIEKNATDSLITIILEEEISGEKKKLIEIFKDIKKLPPVGSTGWKGYLLPAVNDDYIFAVVNDNAAPLISIDGQELKFTAQEDPSNLWLSDPVKLLAGKSYLFEAPGLTADLKDLSWKTSVSPKAPIPSSVLLPDYSAKTTEDSFIKLKKAGLLVNGFNLTDVELLHFFAHKSDFNDLDFNKLTTESWLALESYTRLRNSLEDSDTTLIEFFNWCSQTNDPAKLTEKIAELTKWKKEDLDKLITANHFNLNHPEHFKNAKNLLKLQKALYVMEKISMDADLLFNWAKPTSKFYPCHAIAESIRKSIRARYSQEDWEQVVKPLNDQLRENQKNALISYLLVQQDLIDWGVIDANSLFEFFLIDVQMDACMETSRIKQAISSVQLYIQRCFLGLESKYGVASNILDRPRWDWMSRNVIWQANRKVFLYPENWIDENLRDDKTQFYKELESELLQKDINKQNVQDALKSYLYKVDEVSNMQVVGLHVDQLKQVLHVFSRTRNAPYFFYYRHYDIAAKNWYPWEKVQVDIPCYDVEDANSKVTDNGCYLVPLVFNNRLMIFFPQILKKTIAPAIPAEVESTPKAKFAQATHQWEIKMGWSEYRNSKWTQKQISKDAIYDTSATLIDKFNFVPFVHETDVVIGAYSGNNGIDGFTYTGTALTKNTQVPPVIASLPAGGFHYLGNNIYSLQSNGTSVPMLSKEPFFIKGQKTSVDLVPADPSFDFNFPHTNTLLKTVNKEDPVELFQTNLNLSSPDDTFGKWGTTYHELKKPYSIYAWETFCHVPMTIANKLTEAKQFEEAMKWYHYVFNPLADGLEANRAWQFLPFRKTDHHNFLDEFFNSLKPMEKNDQITEWRDKPFQPHVIARSRPSAYMKWVVMKYCDCCISWADYLFRQDTIESLNYATQLYIRALHVLGQQPQLIPKRGKIKAQTYKSLLDKWDAFGNAMVELELAFPFSNQISQPLGNSNGVVGTANIFGFASSLYFCIPNNSKLMGYWDTINDRLYKIRHCQNIEGVFRKLALWDPPIDPALLVKAAAHGLSLDSVLSDLNAPMPNYRFNFLIQKALELCNELKSMGQALLTVMEKKDSEMLAKMRAGHEKTMHEMVMELKKLQLEEANKSLDALQQNRKTPVYRLQHYLRLIGEDLNKIPNDTADFNEIANQLETPISESELKLIAYEKEEMDKASDAQDWQKAVGISEAIASIFHIIPNIEVAGKPFGVGAGVAFGGQFLGNAAQSVAKGLQIKTSELTYQSASSQRKGGFLRALQDRVMQANMAGYEIKQIDKQIVTQQIRIQLTSQEITNQQKQIDNAIEVDEFLRNKYTNEELYNWMAGSIKTLYHQVYTLAYDIAKKAEKVYRFERGLTNSNYIQFGYWDASRDGLHAGERLYLGIKQLEAAWQEKRGYDYEITKPVSLRQVNPLALLELKEKGKCEFELPEILFDMDFPGHYMRRIKAISVSIPCIAGPYTSINATLRLLENKFRTSAIAKDKKDYLEKIDVSDDRFTTVNIPVTAIAVTTGLNDTGLFELNFKDERYLPFEGAGVTSKWRLEFPAEFRQFDYSTISDAIINIRYTSVEGGDKLKKVSSDALKDYIKSVEELAQREGLFSLIDLKHDFPNEWYKATQLPPAENGRVMSLGNLTERLPVYTRSFDGKKIKARDFYVAASPEIGNNDFSFIHKDGDPISLQQAGSVGEGVKLFRVSEQDETLDNWNLKFKDDVKEPEKMWLIMRYTLEKG